MSARPGKADQATNAVIYCRTATRSMTSSARIDSQEERCRDFARLKGYSVKAVFWDEGFAGSSMDRPGLNSMLAFLDDVAEAKTFIVVADDVARLSRSMAVHFKVTDAIADAGARLEFASTDLRQRSRVASARILDDILSRSGSPRLNRL